MEEVRGDERQYRERGEIKQRPQRRVNEKWR